MVSLSSERKAEANWTVCLADGDKESQQQSAKCQNLADLPLHLSRTAVLQRFCLRLMYPDTQQRHRNTRRRITKHMLKRIIISH